MRDFNGVFALILALFVTSAEVDAATRKPKVKAPARAACVEELKPSVTLDDHSVQKGLLMHGEHFVDLVLAQASNSGKEHLAALDQIAEGLLGEIKKGQFAQINEKIDGSPSVVFGWNKKGEPFVAYKNHFSSTKKQKLITSEELARGAFSRSEALKSLFSKLFSAVTPLMKKRSGLRDLIFQGDLLFVEEDPSAETRARKTVSADQITIRANAVEYTIHRGDPLFEAIRTAKVGLAIHTVGERVIGDEGRLGVKALGDRDTAEPALNKFIKLISSPEVFAMHPLRDKVSVAPAAAPAQLEAARASLSEVNSRLLALPTEFHSVWRAFEPEIRVFFNSQVRPPNRGGVYLAVAQGQKVEATHVVSDFEAWLSTRAKDHLLEKLKTLSTEDRAQFESVISAYLAAIRFQYQVQPYMSEALKSKLGGGPVEGLILTTDTAIVKWVDRLSFTMLNNAVNQRAPTLAPEEAFRSLPPPFNEWRPGVGVVLMKGQPVHGGHIQMILEATSQVDRLIILASNKEPDLAATTLTKLGAAKTVADYKAENYVHVFSNQLRGQIFGASFADAPVEIELYQSNIGLFWKYLEAAKRSGAKGKVKLVVGQKEVDEGRYDEQLAAYGDQLELLPMAPQKGGVSGTEIREKVRAAAKGSKEARAELDEAYSFISDRVARRRIIEQMINEWQKLDARVKEIESAKKVKKSA